MEVEKIEFNLVDTPSERILDKRQSFLELRENVLVKVISFGFQALKDPEDPLLGFGEPRDFYRREVIKRDAIACVTLLADDGQVRVEIEHASVTTFIYQLRDWSIAKEDHRKISQWAFGEDLTES